MKKELGIAVSLASLFAASALAESEKRELGAHEHGHSVLNVAIEGDRVEMELTAPGADIVGFEHEASSAEDKAAVEQAEATLGEPLSLFGFTDAAGCVVETVAVEIEGEEHHDEHGDEAHAEEEHHDEEHAEDEHDEEGEEHTEHEEHEDEASHNEFHAEYGLSCSTPDALDGIDFAAFFEAFAGAEEVEVTVISENGQSSYEVERDAPVVDLQGVI
ncbi:MAG: zinc uptake protein ZrgA [Geminicoccaceae bacterium]